MTKQELWQYTKKTSFWLTYCALMGLNLFTIYFFSVDLYYEIFDPVYWRDNFTMYPYVEVEIPTSFNYKLKMLLYILFVLGINIWGNYRLYKKKKGVLWILAFLVYIALGSFIYIDILGWGAWCPGYDFP
ncbi:MAG: hypothetical protein NC218_01195 [Acetobacter sp.]|nr:hypothetical protein [Acetobacter sp.]